MKNYLTVLIIALILSSCATVLNTPTKKVTITTTGSALVVYNGDTLSTKRDRVSLDVVRRKEPITVQIINDTFSKTLTINSRNSFEYWLNAYPSPMLWTGFLIDKKNPKRYAFPGRIYVDMRDTISRFLHYDPRDRKGQIHFVNTYPWVNSFYLQPDNEGLRSNTGFMGISVGLDYYHRNKQFINFSAGVASDIMTPFPAPIHYNGLYETMGCGYLVLSNNHKLRNVSLGYGLSYNSNSWNLRNNSNPLDTLTFGLPPRSRSSKALGLVFPIYLQTGKYFYLGMIYRPSVFRVSSSNHFEYEHLISFEFGWKITVKK